MSRVASILSRWRAAPLAPLLWLLAPALLLGLFWTDDYGMGADEYANATVGREALRAYTRADSNASFLERDSLGHHGPSYFAVFAAVGDGLRRIVPAWQPADGRHLSKFMTFLLASLGPDFMCLRLLPRGAALAAAPLFLTQPLLFGHGFINHKDLPFTAFFLLTIVVGLAGVDRLAAVGSLGDRARPDLHVSSPFASSRPAFTLVCDYQRGAAGVDLSQPVVYGATIAGVNMAEVRQGDTAEPGDGSP